LSYGSNILSRIILLFIFFVAISKYKEITMDTLEIPVTYKNEELSFKAHVVRFGYVNHIVVDLGGPQITIERDEEGNYRALGQAEKLEVTKVDTELVEAVVNVLQSL
jgi:hypothetical protein